MVSNSSSQTAFGGAELGQPVRSETFAAASRGWIRVVLRSARTFNWPGYIAAISSAKGRSSGSKPPECWAWACGSGEWHRPRISRSSPRASEATMKVESRPPESVATSGEVRDASWATTVSKVFRYSERISSGSSRWG